MMNDMQVAVGILKVLNNVDGGCAPCARAGLDDAKKFFPDLPWDMAVQGLNNETLATDDVPYPEYWWAIDK